MLKYISCARLQTTVQVRHCRGCKPEKKISFFFQVDALFKEKKNTAICKCQLHSRLKSALCCLCEMRNMRGVFFFPVFFFFLEPLDVFPSCRLRLSITCRFAPQWVYRGAAVGEGFYLGSRFNTQQSTPKIDSTFEMPQTPVRCGFKVQNGIATPPCLGWIKKKGNKHPVLPFPATLCFYFCLDWCQQCLKESSFFPSSFFRHLVVWSQVKNYLEKNTLCQPAARRAHKQDHLAIISSQPQIRAAKQTFIRKNGRREEE